MVAGTLALVAYDFWPHRLVPTGYAILMMDDAGERPRQPGERARIAADRNPRRTLTSEGRC